MFKKFLRQKNKGDASTALLSIFLVMLLVLPLIFTLFYPLISDKAQGVQDDVTLSNLAIYKNIDMDVMAQTGDLVVSDPYSAFETFKKHLKYNMKLDDSMNGLQGSTAVGQVTVEEFTIYNVQENNIQILTYSNNNHMFTSQTVNRTMNVVKTSDNSIVKHTSVHVTIKYNVNVLFGKQQTVETSVDTDITK